jgi:hypothetical protein
MRLFPLAAAFALLGGALLLVGLHVGPPSVDGIEGAYFTRAAGEPAFSGAFHSSGAGLALWSPHDGNLWIGAGLAYCTAAAGALAAAVARRAR